MRPALVITHFFMVKKESCTDALIGESFVAPEINSSWHLKHVAKNSLEFYIKKLPEI